MHTHTHMLVDNKQHNICNCHLKLISVVWHLLEHYSYLIILISAGDLIFFLFFIFCFHSHFFFRHLCSFLVYSVFITRAHTTLRFDVIWLQCILNYHMMHINVYMMFCWCNVYVWSTKQFWEYESFSNLIHFYLHFGFLILLLERSWCCCCSWLQFGCCRSSVSHLFGYCRWMYIFLYCIICLDLYIFQSCIFMMMNMNTKIYSFWCYWK